MSILASSDCLLSAQLDKVRSNPDSSKERVYLFQLMLINGLWDKSLIHLKAAASFDAACIPMAQAYREVIRCEVFREKVFQGEKQPLILGEPYPWLVNLMQSLAEKSADQAEALRHEAFSQAEATSGTIDGKSFEWVADADSRLGPVLEVILNGQYYWVPFSRIKKITIEPPEDLRDLVWLPAMITLCSEGEVPGFIPVRYPFTYQQQDNELNMSKKTSWQPYASNEFHGLGQRLLVTDSEEFSLLDIREIVLNTESQESMDG